MQIATARLVLRDFEHEDWPAVHAYQNNPLYLRYYAWTARTPEAVQEFVGWFVAQQEAQPRIKYQLAVTLKLGGQLIGNCGIRRETAGASEADIGYELDPNYWGRGYATEAAQAVVDFGFRQLGLHRIEANCVADNEASARLLEKVGMTLEGRLRDKEYYKGRWWDSLLYAVLDHEWRARQGGNAG